MMIANCNNTNTCYGYGSQYQQILTEHEELRRKRKVNKSDQIQELLLQNRRKIHNEKMKLVCGSCYLPKDNPDKPLGEDAHFICHDGRTIGVADGVGGWAKIGVDAGVYARGLMNNANQTAMDMTQAAAAAVDPRNVLNQAYANNAGVQGSSTACILSLNKESGALHAVNVGDSGFMVFRDSRCLYKSPPQQRMFNCPYQLGNYVGYDCPKAALEFVMEAVPGDIIVLGTDGLLDNMFPSEIEDVLVAYRGSGRDCEELASAIANLALFNSLDKYSVSPFQMEAQKAGLEHAGGKIDDITVVVAQVVASSSFTTPASLGFGFERTDTKRKREGYIRFRN
ncbi:PREDICTED: probable protein phosphatase 2C 55 [Prunus mume]|uniref:Protein phosphatase n=1 Tax=Prunus mume TaxID=102107 RepID=A0ABM0NLI8_PRUMU|nr:PREDICTED: probable protein phosphatase 2C 55 [Prunus mume]